MAFAAFSKWYASLVFSVSSSSVYEYSSYELEVSTSLTWAAGFFSTGCAALEDGIEIKVLVSVSVKRGRRVRGRLGSGSSEGER